MGGQDLVQMLVDGLVVFATDLLIPVMSIFFIVGVALRALIYYTVKREYWFAREFEKRAHAFIEGKGPARHESFYVNMKRLLEKTYYELFEVRAIMKRRNPDFVMTLSDRIFLIQHGVAWLIKDLLRNIKFLKYDGHKPKLMDITKNVFQHNRCFNKVFGVFPTALFNDVLNILPGIFIIGGIFGTFLGIMKALPELGNMDLTDVEGTKAVMDTFLLKISFSMTTSIVGIIVSVCMTFVNTIFSADRLFVHIVERFENTTDIIWNRSINNALPSDLPDFDENKDPLEALAEEALNKEIENPSKVQWGKKKATVPPSSQDHDEAA